MDRARLPSQRPIEVFDVAMRDRAFARLELENELRRALERDELELHYQPIVALAGRRLAGFEALVRWRRGPNSLMAPGEFIRLAEQTGLIVPLGAWALRRACRQLAGWRSTPGALGGLSVSVNVSGAQLERAELAEEIGDALGSHGVPPSALKLEITESAFVDHAGPARAVLGAIEALGVGVWLDDFGTGYSSLSSLHQLPIEAMKIDRSFVVALDAEPARTELVSSIVLLARGLGLRTVAEGAETPAQVERLDAFGCDFVQGHAISLPLAPDDATALVLGARLVH